MATTHLKGKEIRTSGMLPKLGINLPDFILSDADLHDKQLHDFKDKCKLLYFVPSLDTGVCLLSTKKIDEALSKIPNAMALIISCDLPFAMKRVCGLENLTHVTPLSAFRSKDFLHEMGVLIEEGPLKGLCARAIVVVDEQNQVLYTELVSEITNEPNYELALQTLKR